MTVRLTSPVLGLHLNDLYTGPQEQSLIDGGLAVSTDLGPTAATVTANIRNRVPLTGLAYGEYGVSVTPSDGRLGPEGRSLVTSATANTNYSVITSLGRVAQIAVTSSGGGTQPTLTLSGPLTFAAGAASGTLVANIANVPAGATPTLTPNDGRLAIAGDATNGWKVVVGLSASTANTTIALSVAAAGATASAVSNVPVTAASTVANLFVGSAGLYMPYGTFNAATSANRVRNSARIIYPTWNRSEDYLLLHNIAQASGTGNIGVPSGEMNFTKVQAVSLSSGEVIPFLFNGAVVSDTNPVALNSGNNFARGVKAQKALNETTGYRIETTDIVEVDVVARLLQQPAISAPGETTSYGCLAGLIHFARPSSMSSRDGYRSFMIVDDSTEDQPNALGQPAPGHIRRALISTDGGGRIANFAFARFGSATPSAGKALGLNIESSSVDASSEWMLPVFTREFGTQARLPFSTFLSGHFRNESATIGALRVLSREVTARVKLADPLCVVGYVDPWPYTNTTDSWQTEANQTNATGAASRAGWVAFIANGGDGMLGGGIDFSWKMRDYIQSLTSNNSADAWPATGRSGALAAAQAADNSAAAVLSLNFAPSPGDTLVIEPAGGSNKEIVGPVRTVSGSGPYTVSLSPSISLPSNKVLIAHAQGAAVAAINTQDGTHESHSLMLSVSDWEKTQKATAITAEAVVDSPGTLLMRDTFTDTSGKRIIEHTAESGGSWSLHNGITTQDALLIDANGAVYANTAGSVYYTQTMPTADYYVEATLVYPANTVATDKPGITVRNLPTNDKYGARYDFQNSRWEVFKSVGGTFTSLGTVSEGAFSQAWANDFNAAGSAASAAYKNNVVRRKLRLAIKGSTLTFSLGNTRNGNYTLVVTDTALTAAGAPGLAFNVAQSATTGIHIEDIKAVSL